MKKILTFIIIIISITNLLAQAPQSFSYQAVVRDATGNIIASSPISLRISILAGSAQGQAVYTETHFTTTNQFGLMVISIGQGTTTYGMFDTIPWNNSSYFIQTEMDATGGANYQLMGTNQILSVPYALYGRDEDYDTINELQDISFINDTLSINRGSSFPVPLGYLGEVKTFAISLSGSISVTELQTKGWAVCNGTTPDSQGIANAIISTTPDMSNKFLKMGDDITSGDVGGAEMHNHQWLYDCGNSKPCTWNSVGNTITAFKSAKYGIGTFVINPNDLYTNVESSLPPYYEVIYFIKVK